MSSLRTEYEEVHRFKPREIEAIAAGRDTFLIRDEDGTWLVDDENQVHTHLHGKLAVGTAPFLLDDDGLKRLAPNGEVFKRNFSASGLDIVSVLDKNLIALRDTDEIRFFDEDTLLESNEIEPRPNPFGNDVTKFVGGFEAVALASGNQVLWYLLSDEKVFQVELHDRVLDIGFFEGSVVITTDSKLAAFDMSTGDRKWVTDSVAKLSNRGRTRLHVGGEDFTHFLPDGSQKTVGDSGSLLTVTPMGSRRLRETSTGRIVLERRTQSLAISVPEPDLQVGSEDDIPINIQNLSDSAERGQLNVKISGGEVVSKSDNGETIEFSLLPSETLETTITIRPDAASLVVKVGNEKFSFSANRPEPAIEAKVISTQFNSDGPEAVIRISNTGPISLGWIKLSASNHIFYESSKELPSGEQREVSISLPRSPGDEVNLKITTTAIDSERGVTVETSVTVPEEPIVPDISFRESDERNSIIDIRLENQGNHTISELIHVKSPLGTIEYDLDFTEMEVQHLLLPLFDPPVGIFDVEVEGDSELLSPERKSFVGKPPLEVERELTLWPDIELDNGSDNIPKGEAFTEEIHISNQTEESLRGLRIEGEGGVIEELDKLDPNTTAVLTRTYALYNTGLPAYDVSSTTDDIKASLPETNPPTEGDLVVRANILLQETSAELQFHIENHSDRFCEIDGVGIENVGFWLLSENEEASLTIPPEGTDTISKSIDSPQLDTISQDYVTSIVDYSFEEWSLITQRTTTITPVCIPRLEDFIDVTISGKGRQLVIMIENGTNKSIPEVTLRYRKDTTSEWEETVVADSLEVNNVKKVTISGLGPSGILSGTTRSEIEVEARLQNGRRVVESYEASAKPSLGSPDWDINREGDDESTSFNQTNLIAGERDLHLEES